MPELTPRRAPPSPNLRWEQHNCMAQGAEHEAAAGNPEEPQTRQGLTHRILSKQAPNHGFDS